MARTPVDIVREQVRQACDELRRRRAELEVTLSAVTTRAEQWAYERRETLLEELWLTMTPSDRARAERRVPR